MGHRVRPQARLIACRSWPPRPCDDRGDVDPGAPSDAGSTSGHAWRRRLKKKPGASAWNRDRRQDVDHRKFFAHSAGLGHPDGTPNFCRNHVSEIDRNVEFRKITRELDGLPPERTRTQVRLERIQEIVAKDRFNERLVLIGIWARLVLITALVLSLFWWPYGHRCGFPLAAYLISNAVVIVGGVTLAVRGWRDRMVPVFVGSALCIAIA